MEHMYFSMSKSANFSTQGKQDLKFLDKNAWSLKLAYFYLEEENRGF